MESREFVDFYKFLGIDSSCTIEQIEEACIQQGEKYRSGKDRNDLVAAMNFARTEQAYETLINPEKKAAYDRVYQDYLLNPRHLVDNGHAIDFKTREGAIVIICAIAAAAIAMVLCESPVNTSQHSWIDAIRWSVLEIFYFHDPDDRMKDRYLVTVPLPLLLLFCFLLLLYGFLVLRGFVPRPSMSWKKLKAWITPFFRT